MRGGAREVDEPSSTPDANGIVCGLPGGQLVNNYRWLVGEISDEVVVIAENFSASVIDPRDLGLVANNRHAASFGRRRWRWWRRR